ncbi:24062_t:CDS:2, partial [Gigaspora rosea]
SEKDKEIAQLLKTNASIVCIFRCTIELHNWLYQLRVHKYRSEKRLALTTEQNEVAKEMLIEQEYEPYTEVGEENRREDKHESLPSFTNNNSNPISINMGTVQTSDTIAKKITIQNLDCSKAVPELAKSEGETQHNNTEELDEAKRKKIFYFHTRLVWKEAGQAMIQNVNPYGKRIKVVEKEKNGSDIDTSGTPVEPKIKGSNTEVAITIDNT